MKGRIRIRVGRKRVNDYVDGLGMEVQGREKELMKERKESTQVDSRQNKS